MPEMNIIQSLNHTLHMAFAENSRLLTFGEDVGYFGGVFRVTEGLQQKFGEDRCFDSPSPSARSSASALASHK